MDAEATFAAAYDATVGPVYRSIYGRVHDPLLAEDLTQDVYIKGWRNWPEFLAKGRSPDAVLPWLLRIARNTVIDHWRSRKAVDVPTDQGPDFAEVFTGGYDNRALLARIMERVTLPSREKLLLVLIYEEGLSLSEAAAVMGISVNAAKCLLRRATARLRAAAQTV